MFADTYCSKFPLSGRLFETDEKMQWLHLMSMKRVTNVRYCLCWPLLNSNCYHDAIVGMIQPFQIARNCCLYLILQVTFGLQGTKMSQYCCTYLVSF